MLSSQEVLQVIARSKSKPSFKELDLIKANRSSEELTKTIEAYVEQGFSLTDASQVLFIHRNTLKTRLETLAQRLLGLCGGELTLDNFLALYLMVKAEELAYSDRDDHVTLELGGMDITLTMHRDSADSVIDDGHRFNVGWTFYE